MRGMEVMHLLGPQLHHISAYYNGDKNNGPCVYEKKYIRQNTQM